MMGRKCLYWLQCIFFINLCILASDTGTSDPFSSQPRIIVQDGHLTLKGALNRNVTLSAGGQGKVQVNGLDLGRIAASVQDGSLQSSSISNLQQRMAAILSQRTTILNLSSQVSQLEENITEISNRVNQFVGSGQDRISNRGLRRVIQKVQRLGDQLTNLTQLLNKDDCSSGPCQNGGTCTDMYNGYICSCPSNFQGRNCDVDINECAVYAGTSYGCQNGATCVNFHGGYRCDCATNWYGIHCTEKHDDCSIASHQELCGHGTCIDEPRVQPGQPKYRCICDPGWQKSSSSPACTEDIDECAAGEMRCSQNPLVTCINLPGTFHCGPCPAGYTGNGRTCSDINECEFRNGGCSMQPFVQCTNTLGSRMCGPCPAGYLGNGEQCMFVGVCSINRGGCHPLATCIENTAITGTYRECRCPPGYIGTGEGLQGCVASEGMSCANNPCLHGACQMVGQSFHCSCYEGYFGTLCDQQHDPCFSSPCQNGATCVRGPGSFSCVCPQGFTGLTCADGRSACGGYLQGNNGTLEFPETGLEYNHFENCAWVITVDEGKVVNVTFEHFNLEAGYNCEFDFLQIHDGPTFNSRLIGRYCHHDLEGVTLSNNHNELYLWFRSDNSVAGTGMKLRWIAAEPVCGGLLNISEFGSVNSPGYPGTYPRNRNCTWTVRVPYNKKMLFHFATLKLEHHENCSYDYLKVYDGETDRDPVLGTYCTTVTPPPVTTSGHAATLFFHSDHSVEDNGFHITYSALPKVEGCGGILTNPIGSIQSPNFPDTYENNLQCEWLIRLHPNSRILITFKEFGLERHTDCRFDYVEIYNGNSENAPLVGRYCGATMPPDFLSISNQLYIVFRSDISVAYQGFKLQYRTICGGVFTELTGVLSSPNYPDSYPASATCVYEIKLPTGFITNLTITNLEIESHPNCAFDYLEVRDGDTENSRLMEKMCGYSLPGSLISTYNNLWMKFVTDGSVQNLGFYAQYEAIEIGCGGVMTENSGQIATPLHPDRYPLSITCMWLIRAPEAHIIQLTFTSFDLEMSTACRFDHVVIEDTDGMQIGEKYCGSQMPPIITSTDNNLLIKFESDYSVAKEGFIANYVFLDASQACGGEYYREAGVIRSPGFPSHYPHSAHCVWVLHGKNLRQITLNVTQFNLEFHQDCRFDFLEIRNGGYDTSPLLGRFCGDQITPAIRSHSSVLRLEFKSDYGSSASGFEIFYDSASIGCGGTLSSPRGTIISPNYPQPYPLNADCEWLIRVSEGSLISLSIVEIDIEEQETCRYDYLQAYDGSTQNSKSLIKLCNNQQNPGVVTSTGNTMLLRFRSDYSEAAGGFHVAYQTVCNNRLKKRRGVIESPNFPNTYPHNHNCTWTIEAPVGNNVTLAFSHLFLEGGESCDADYVEVLELRNSEPVQLGKYCGSVSVPPSAIETSSNVALVRLVTDRSISREGFRLEWSMKGCGGDIRDKNLGFITSPNYPNGYPFNTECYWHIWYPPGNQVELTILDMDMEGSGGCYYDYLRVYGGEDENSPRLLNACHRLNNSVITSHGNNIVVHFHSDGSVIQSGFKAKFRKLAGGCGGYFTTEEGTIMTSNFPNPYTPNEDCEWLIEVDQSYSVNLVFYEFDVPQYLNCSRGHISIHDGADSSAPPLLLRHCGGKPEQTISSTGNQMLVKLVADGNNVGRGFRAHYTTGCGTRLLADNGGDLMTPNYPHGSVNVVECSWILYTSVPGEKVIATVTNLHAPNNENCTSRYLRFKDGDMPDSPIIADYCGPRVPPPIVSRGSTLHIILANFVIFRATYGVASTHCGGSFVSLQGTFATPGYPGNYDMDMECVWTIEASAGSKTQISFQSFDLEDSDHCNTDYVEIHENDAAGRLIGKYCGNRIPNNVTAAHKLWIKFRSDDVGTAGGFMAHFETQHITEINGTEGEIASPGYPNMFHSTVDFQWTVTVPDSMIVNVRILDIAIPRISDSYCYTSLQIHDGFSDEEALLGEFCGYDTPEPVTSSGNSVTIKFAGNPYYQSSFRLHWVAVAESGVVVQEPTITQEGNACWEEIILNATEEATISSPNYPENYLNNLNCTYIIRAPAFQHVELRIEDVEMEGMNVCPYDKLQIYHIPYSDVDDWQLNATVCGRQENLVFASPSNMMKLVFKTDGSVTRKGFRAVAQSKCGSRLRGSYGVINSSSIHPHLRSLGMYDSFQCDWSIVVRQRRTIQLTFDNFNVESDGVCSTNYIMVRNGASLISPPLGNGKYCGSNIPAIPETSSNEANVQVSYQTETRRRPPAFLLRFTELSVGCGGHLYLSDVEGTQYTQISSPNYPLPPVHDTECEWVITSPSGTRMRVDFEKEFHMSLDCYAGEDVEFLELRDGGTEMADVLHRFCGHDQPSSVMTTGNALYVRYVTAVDQPEAGFKANVQIAQCGGTISSYSTIIQSPHYPQDYSSSLECEWFLKMKNGYHIILKLTDLETPTAANCSLTDFLEIRDYDSEGEVLGTYCGRLNDGPITISVPSPQAYVRFKSNSAINAKGFQMTMEGNFEGCGGMVEGPSGVIVSPNYPNAMRGNRDCYWRIVAPEGRRVQVTFNEFNLPSDEETGMCLSFMRVFNVTYWRSSRDRMHKLCGSTLPDPIDSSTGNLNVAFSTHGLAAGEGFSLTYNTEAEAVCGGVMPLPSGVISTPAFQAQPDSYIECKWKFFGDGYENQTIVINFDILDLPGSMANYCMDGVLFLTGDQNYYYMGRYCGNYTSRVIATSPFSTTVLRLVASLQTPFRGVHATYNVSNCGGVLSGANATIMSPGYPNNYPTSVDCHWLIRVPDGEEIRLTIEDIQMEENCAKDYLIIRNGFHTSSPQLGKFCGTHIPAPIVSTSYVLAVIFHSDEYGSAKGFRLTSNEIQRGCGGLIHMHNGNFSSPNYPSRYGNNVECKWTVEYDSGYLVKLEFQGRFDIEMDSSCSKDYLLIEDYEENDTWSVREKKCGSSTPQPIFSKSRKIRVTFHTNDRITGDGFSLKYSAECGGNFTSKVGSILSPNYPDFYKNGLSCTYSIGKSGDYISLSFDPYFSVEGHSTCVYDYVEIIHQADAVNGSVGTFCGTEVPAARTLTGPVIVKFVTDGSYTAHGFKANYEILDCGAAYTEPEGIISIPQESNEYINQMDCTWKLIAQPNRVIALRFMYLKLHTTYRCYRDYIDIRDGNETSPRIGKICGGNTPKVKSTGGMLTLRFRSEYAVESRGFSAFYYNTYGISQGCGGMINASSGEVSSLDANSDGLYEPNLDCSWLILSTEPDKVLRLTFDRFNIEASGNGSCTYDYLELREDVSPDAALIGTYCGSVTPNPVITSGNKVGIIFHSDDQTNKAGFKITFTSIPSPCGPSVLTTSPVNQTFTSPNYPRPYPVNLRCRWTITKNASAVSGWHRQIVQVSLTDMDIPCGGDYIEFFKIRDYLNVSPLRLCGPVHTQEVIGLSGLSIIFHSDAVDNGARGFSIAYKDSDCSRIFTRDSGSISNTAYPGRYNAEDNCSVTVNATQGRTIALYFKRFEIYSQNNCNNSYLKVYDGPTNSSRLIGKYCGYTAPNPIFSTSNSLFLYFAMQNNYGVFYITYITADGAKGCGGSIYAREGSISSPMYPVAYNETAECVWSITVPGYHSVKLDFIAFSLNSSAGCETNYLEIFDGHSTDIANRVVRYCGTDIPGTHDSRGNEVSMKLVTDTSNSGYGFLVHFETNPFVPDASQMVLQRYTEDIDVNSPVIYLT